MKYKEGQHSSDLREIIIVRMRFTYYFDILNAARNNISTAVFTIQNH